MAQLRFPGTHPHYVRLECVYEGELGWTLRVLEADDARYIAASQLTSYPFLAWGELADVVAAVLDGVVSGEAGPDA